MAAGSTYAISGTGLSADELRSLRRWMLDVRSLSGPINLQQADPQPGEMGSLTDALVVAAGSGGAITAIAASTWACGSSAVPGGEGATWISAITAARPRCSSPGR